MVAVDPERPKRTWRDVIRFMIEEKPPGPTRRRLEILEKDKALKPLWPLRVVETRAEQLLLGLTKGTVSNNVQQPAPLMLVSRSTISVSVKG